MGKLFYDIGWWYAIINAYPVQWLFFKRKTYYEDGIKNKSWKNGGALVISNHYNVIDYMLNTFLVLPRKLNVVAGEVAYRNKFMHWGMKFFGGIQANRVTRDMSFIDKSAEVIAKGQLVQIFPEGRNTPDGNIHPFKKSYIVISHRANAPIIPIISDGNYGFFKRTHVIVGKPIYISDYISSDVRMPTKAQLETVNEIVFNKVLELKQRLEELKSSKKHKKSQKKKEKQ